MIEKMNEILKTNFKIIKKKFKKLFTRENIVKMVVIISGTLLVVTSILPYLV